MTEPINWSPGVTLEEVEKLVILKAFRFYRGNKTTTSNALGISVRTLDNKLEKYENDGAEQRRKLEAQRARETDFLHRQRGLPSAPPNSTHEDQERTRSGVSGNNAPAGVRLESAALPPAQLAVSVQERQEVQSVLPKQAASGGQKRNR